jgi:hypothetical protein
MTEGNFVYYDEDMTAREAFRPDMALAIDSPVEVLAEQFMVGITVALAIHNWHVQVVERTEKIALARALGQVVSYLLRPHKNRKVRDIGIAFSLGFARELNGIRDMADAAAKFGCTRALISHEKRKFDKHMLPPGTSLYGKSPSACKKYREARLRVLARNGNHPPTSGYGATSKNPK